MKRALADTSLFIASESGRTLSDEGVPDTLAISIITLAELRAGVLAARDLQTRARRLTTLSFVAQYDVIVVDASVAEAWGQLRVALRDAGRRLGVNDSWVAATAIALDVPLVSQDRGFEGVPGLWAILV